MAGFTAAAEAAQLAEDGKYSEALEKLGEIGNGELYNPALVTLVANLEQWVGALEGVDKAIENDDYVGAVDILIDQTGLDSGFRAMFKDAVMAYELLQNLKSVLEGGAWSVAIEAVRVLNAQVTDPAASVLLKALEIELMARAAEQTGQDLPRDTAAA